MATAVFPGSFDPVTTGHMDLIERASAIFDVLVIGVLNNSSKSPFFTIEERVQMLEKLTSGMPGTSVLPFNGLLTDFVKMTGADAIIRGVRSSSDFEYELPLAQANYKLNYKADTLFLAARPEHSYISSSAVKELARYKGDIRGFVPEKVYQFIKQKFDSLDS